MIRCKRVLAVLAWLTTGITFIVVVVPSVSKFFLLSYDWNNQWIGFQLKDEAGQMHVGFADLSFALGGNEYMSYGYQTPDPSKAIDGFKGSDEDFVWYDHNSSGGANLKSGTRLGLAHAIPHEDQTELTLPGAPWDTFGPILSFLGTFPNYEVKFNDENLGFNLKLNATTPAWYMYNAGQPFRAGDFGLMAMNELPCSVTGSITHKKTGKTFAVSGTALMEGNIGIPCNANIAFGTHDWTEMHFPGGWSGSLWRARDDWQWGYHRYPNIGWLWDPELRKFLTFYRVDIIDADYVTDEVNGIEFPRRSLWRAIGPDATLEVENTNLSCIRRESRINVLVNFKMAYGPNACKGRLLRRNGTVVELGTGTGFMELWPAVIPDIVFWGPTMLILLVLTWSAYAALARRIAGKSILPPMVWCAMGLFAVWALNLAWS